MVVARHITKTLWQTIYSLFGFWTYVSRESEAICKRTLYWMLFPWGPFYRKIDLLTWDINNPPSLFSFWRKRQEHHRHWQAVHEFNRTGFEP